MHTVDHLISDYIGFWHVYITDVVRVIALSGHQHRTDTGTVVQVGGIASYPLLPVMCVAILLLSAILSVFTKPYNRADDVRKA